ncbi:ABC transporter substrate-binding protein [Pseudonocardia nigra]|uniref:ABC transporter substrate-binding protein n=1 Tax=Pseudonocardia nigra TaxID=1921578 RepID=UPI001C5D24CB|nr:ABC transporter substrate-binding protein [Pseudonocardia nigra]
MPDGSGAGDGPDGGTLRVGQEYDLGTLDPQVLTSVGDKQMTTNIFEGLVKYELGGVNVVPCLATEWSTDDAGTTWTFQLRQGVQFHKDFGELTSRDVVFSLERLLDPALASPNASLLSSLESVRAEGDYTVVLELTTPDPALTDKLASSYTGIVSEKAVTEKGAGFPRDPVGTGPYQFERWTPGQETVLTAFGGYWDGKPALGQVSYKAIPDVTTRNNAFAADEIDMIQVTDPDILARYEGNPDIEISSVPGLITRFFGMKTDVAPFDDPRVRKAVTLAIDRDAMLDGLFKGISTPATGILSPATNYASENLLDYRYDPAEATRLMGEAGYAGGVDVTFTVPNIDRFTRPATVIQQDLAKIGVRVEIRVMEAQSMLAALKSPEGLQMFILSRGQEPAPDRVLATWFSTDGIPENNWARISDPEVDQWLAEATATLDEATRADLFGKVQQRIAEGNAYYYIDHEDFLFATHSRVKGFVGDPLRSIRLDNVSLAVD